MRKLIFLYLFFTSTIVFAQKVDYPPVVSKIDSKTIKVENKIDVQTFIDEYQDKIDHLNELIKVEESEQDTRNSPREYKIQQYQDVIDMLKSSPEAVNWTDVQAIGG